MWTDPSYERIAQAIKQAAEESIHYVQLQEALGRPPSVSEFGSTKLHDIMEGLQLNAEAAWEVYASSIGVALQR